MDVSQNSERIIKTTWEMKKNGYAETAIEITAKRLRSIDRLLDSDPLIDTPANRESHRGEISHPEIPTRDVGRLSFNV